LGWLLASPVARPLAQPLNDVDVDEDPAAPDLLTGQAFLVDQLEDTVLATAQERRGALHVDNVHLGLLLFLLACSRQVTTVC
jgi:hypothetical protein